ncbi:hypothetical protein OY671_008565, partial [Metschnikowia pulcherrima]
LKNRISSENYFSPGDLEAQIEAFPYAYLSDVLARIVTRSDTDPIDDSSPSNWIDTNAGQTVFERTNIATAA